jgi:flagellar motor protein MotB
VVKERMRPEGFASAYPLGPNATEEGRALNRRTEVVLGL